MNQNINDSASLLKYWRLSLLP